MYIVLLPSPAGAVVAWEEACGQREGQFIALSTGSVVYQNPADTNDWWAGASLQQFREAAGAWNRYRNEVGDLPEPEQLARVDQLRAELAAIGVLTDEPNALWPVLLEQAEQGML
jgi:hypothetical protein